VNGWEGQIRRLCNWIIAEIGCPALKSGNCWKGLTRQFDSDTVGETLAMRPSCL